ncbi:MAG: lipoprotein-anchoring transpeptidase ErfK/SrfK [Clostridium sp.]
MDKKQLETYVNITSTFVSTTKYFTWVDLNRQRVSIFIGGANHWTLLKTYSCATGNNITPSKRGLFTIQNKGYSFTTDGGALVKYWNAYSGNYLLHSTILNSSGKVVIDGTIGKRVSHGCIRMPLDMAKWYYENIPRGSLVWVN